MAGEYISTTAAGSDRTLAMTSYARVFFRSLTSDEFDRILSDARASGQYLLVERLYTQKVVANIVKMILLRIDRERFVVDHLNDYVQDATVVLMQLARQEKIDLSKSPGEIASYICLWIEQRVKRLARKDQRWRFSLSEVRTEDIEDFAADDEPEKLAGIAAMEGAPSVTKRVETIDYGRTEPGHVSDWRRDERNIVSVFGMPRSRK